MKKENRPLGNRKVSPRASLDIIPDVVLLRVFCLLDDIDLYVLSLCTTRMRHLTYSDVIWNGKYKQRFYSSPSTCNWQGLNYVQEYYRLSATRTLRTSIKSIELCKARKISTLSGVCHLRLLGNRILVSFADGAMKSIVVEDGTEESIVNVCDDLERIQSEREKEKLRGDLVAAHKNALFAFKLRKFGRSDEIDLWSASESHECTKVVEPISPVSAFAQSSESASQEGESQESETLTPQTSPMLSSSKTRLTSRKGSKKSRRRSSARTRLPVGGLEVLRKTSMNTHCTIDAKVIKDGTMSSVSMSSNSVLSAIESSVTGDGEQFDDFKSPKFVDQIDVTPSDVPKDDVAKTRQGVCVNSMRELNLCDSDSPSSSDSHYGSDSDCSSTGTSQSSEASSPLYRTTRFAIVSSKRTTRSSSSNKRRRNRHRVPIMPVVVTQNAQQIAHRKKFMEHLSRQSNNCDENIMGVAVAHKSIVIVRYGVKSKSKNNHRDLQNTTNVTNLEKQGTFVKRRNRSGIEKNLSVGSKGKRIPTDGNKNTAPENVMDISVDSELLAPTWMTTRDVPVSAIAMTSCIAEKASKTTGKAEDCEISVLTGHTDGSVRTWSSDGTFLSEWKASTGAIIAISVAPSQVTVLISSAEGELSTWDIVSCRKLANMRTNPAGISWPRNDISTSTNYTNRTESSRPRNDIPTDSLVTTCIQIDSEIVVAGWIDGSVGIWNRKGSQLHHQRTESSACTCTFMIGQPQELKNSVELSHMRHTSIVNFALGHSSGNVTVWRGNTEVGIEGNFDSIVLSGHIAQVRQVHMDMHKVVSCGDDGAIKIWGIESTEQGTNASLIRTLRWRGGRSPIVCLAVGPSIIVGGALDGSVQAFAIGNPSKKLSSWAEKFRELHRDGSSTEKAKSQNTSGGRASGRVRQKTSRGSASKRRMKTGMLAYDLTSEYDDDYAMDYSTRQHEFY